jgi:hypothetical protein
LFCFVFHQRNLVAISCLNAPKVRRYIYCNWWLPKWNSKPPQKKCLGQIILCESKCKNDCILMKTYAQFDCLIKALKDETCKSQKKNRQK